MTVEAAAAVRDSTGRRRAGRQRDREDSINRVVVLVGQGGGESGYCNNYTKAGMDKMGGVSTERKRGGRGITEGEEVQEGGKVQDQTNKGLYAYCEMKSSRRGDKRQATRELDVGDG